MPAYVEHHRTMGDRIREIVAAGFVLLDVIEPEWPEDFADTGVSGRRSGARSSPAPRSSCALCRTPDRVTAVVRAALGGFRLMADGGELLILAPGVERFSEQPEVDGSWQKRDPITLASTGLTRSGACVAHWKCMWSFVTVKFA